MRSRASGGVGMRSCASDVARPQSVPGLLCLFRLFCALFTFYGRATSDAQERIPTPPHAGTRAQATPVSKLVLAQEPKFGIVLALVVVLVLGALQPLATVLRLIFQQPLHLATKALAPVMHAMRPCRFQLDPLCGCQHLVDFC